MAERPLLLFPQARKKDRTKVPRYVPQLKGPGVARQKERLNPAFQRLEDAFESRRAELITSATGMEPEKALVIEAARSVKDFQQAVRTIDGLEWLGEFEMDDMDADENFHDVKNPDKKVAQMVTNAALSEFFIGFLRLMVEIIRRNGAGPLRLSA